MATGFTTMAMQAGMFTKNRRGGAAPKLEGDTLKMVQGDEKLAHGFSSRCQTIDSLSTLDTLPGVDKFLSSPTVDSLATYESPTRDALATMTSDSLAPLDRTNFASATVESLLAYEQAARDAYGGTQTVDELSALEELEELEDSASETTESSEDVSEISDESGEFVIRTPSQGEMAKEATERFTRCMEGHFSSSDEEELSEESSDSDALSTYSDEGSLDSSQGISSFSTADFLGEGKSGAQSDRAEPPSEDSLPDVDFAQAQPQLQQPLPPVQEKKRSSLRVQFREERIDSEEEMPPTANWQLPQSAAWCRERRFVEVEPQQASTAGLPDNACARSASEPACAASYVEHADINYVRAKLAWEAREARCREEERTRQQMLKEQEHEKRQRQQAQYQAHQKAEQQLQELLRLQEQLAMCPPSRQPKPMQMQQKQMQMPHMPEPQRMQQAQPSPNACSQMSPNYAPHARFQQPPPAASMPQQVHRNAQFRHYDSVEQELEIDTLETLDMPCHGSFPMAAEQQQWGTGIKPVGLLAAQQCLDDLSEETEEVQRARFHKTELCRFFAQGRCRKDQCRFAHGLNELRHRPNLYKTVLCHQWARSRCPRSSEECPYAHGLCELRQTEGDEEEGMMAQLQ
eukprot:TRINITY_DN121687_c0_g1_i1.p1 TRINITY_DN121687_c0_g1~~TRINITY_DN121687_c0_g1_i1.p1  ORF type:complete len:632 (-),score=174.80 TRINITY_DN121687_c0_g1_i1:371-2266(-)